MYNRMQSFVNKNISAIWKSYSMRPYDFLEGLTNYYKHISILYKNSFCILYWKKNELW